MQDLVGRPEVKGPLGRPKNRLQRNIKVSLSQDKDRRRAVLTAVLNFWVSDNVGDFLTG